MRRFFGTLLGICLALGVGVLIYNAVSGPGPNNGYKAANRAGNEVKYLGNRAGHDVRYLERKTVNTADNLLPLNNRTYRNDMYGTSYRGYSYNGVTPLSNDNRYNATSYNNGNVGNLGNLGNLGNIGNLGNLGNLGNMNNSQWYQWLNSQLRQGVPGTTTGNTGNNYGYPTGNTNTGNGTGNRTGTTTGNTGNTGNTANTGNAGAGTNASIAQQILQQVNAERAKAGLSALTLYDPLTKSAQAKSNDMRDKNYFSHDSPTYGSPFDMMKQFGISYSYAGENIAAGQKSVQEVMTAWMNSPGHKANILSPNFTQLGVGYAQGGSMNPYWTQQFRRP